MNPKALPLRSLVRGAYNLQKLRIAAGQRLVANWKVKLGIAPSVKENEALDKDGQKLLEQIKKDYKKMSDAVVTTYKKFKGEGLITTFTELCLIDQYTDLEKNEKKHFRRINYSLLDHPIYNQFLYHIKGIGPALAGIIISTIDIHKAEFPSSIWKYSGYNVAEDGKGQSRRKEHLIQVTYTDKDGVEKVRDSITFNPWLKTKLRTTAESFMRCKNPYSDVYYHYRQRIDNMEEHKEKIDGHRNAMALRYMIKYFLVDLYIAWRTLEGLPVHNTYQEFKLECPKHQQLSFLQEPSDIEPVEITDKDVEDIMKSIAEDGELEQIEELYQVEISSTVEVEEKKKRGRPKKIKNEEI